MTNALASVWARGGAGVSDGEAAMVARSMIVARDALNSSLPTTLLMDTALSVLLRLFVAHAEARHVAVEDFASSGFAAQTHIVRWLNALESEGLVALSIDGGATCSLSQTGLDQMRGALAAVVQSQTDLHAAYAS